MNNQTFQQQNNFQNNQQANPGGNFGNYNQNQNYNNYQQGNNPNMNNFNNNYQQQKVSMNNPNVFNSNIQQKPNMNVAQGGAGFNQNINNYENTNINKSAIPMNNNNMNVPQNQAMGTIRAMSDDEIILKGRQKLQQIGVQSLPIAYGSPEYKKLLPEIEELYLYASQELLWDSWKNMVMAKQHLKLLKFYLSNIKQ